MAKYTPKTTNSGYNLQNINQNFLDLADWVNNNILCRNGVGSEPNEMHNDLDMNGHDVLNIDNLDVKSFTVNGQDPLAGAQVYVDQAHAYATQAGVSATASADSATASAGSATASATSASGAAGSLSTMQTLFLGAFTSDPVSGAEGSLYYNSTVLELRYRRNGVWVSFPQANTVGRQFFNAGTDFTAGTSTFLTLPATSYTKQVLWVYFDGVYQQPNKYTLTNQLRMDFTAAITAGTTRVEIGYITPLASTVVDDGSITTAKLQDSAVTASKIADGNIATSKIADGAITAAKLVQTSPGLDDIKTLMTITPRVDNISVLRTADFAHYPFVWVNGYYTGNDGGGGLYFITSDTTSTDNGGTIITHTASGRRWYLMQQQPVTMKQFGCKHDGSTDDSAAIQRMVAAGLDLVFPEFTTTVINTPTTISTRMTFKNGAKINAKSTVNLVYKPFADPAAFIFATTTGVFNLLGGSNPWDDCSADWFNVNAEIGQAIQIAWKFSYTVTLNNRNYTWNSSVTPPAQIQGLVLKGKGFRSTFITVANSIIAINYQRVAGQAASSLHVQDLNFTETGLSRTSTAIRFYGTYSGSAGAETTFYDDNWIRVERCVFVGLSRANDTAYTTQSYWTDNYYQANAVCHFMGRDSSFFYFRGEMGLDNTFINGSYIYHQDPYNDARSNGLTVTDCHNVLGSGIDIQLQNYQLAQFENCSVDLGTAGAAAIYLNNCQDIHFQNGWIACTSAARTAGRVGIYSQTTRHSSFCGNTFNSCYIGYQGNNASSVSINDNVFDNSLNADITDISAGVGMVVTGNKHKNNVTSVPIGISAGHANVVVNNIMAGTAYTINAGSNSINSPNIFSAAFPV